MSALALSDLNTEINHEPRVPDLRLAEALGFERPDRIKSLIERHRHALARFGEVFTTAVKTSLKGGRPGKTYWLTKRQALYICTKSEAPLATETTIAMVEVFDAWQRGQLETRYGEIRPGFFRMTIGAREILVDAAAFKIGPGDEAAVCSHHDGKVSILQGPLVPSAHAWEQGHRTVAGPWRETGVPGKAEREFFTVLGRVLPPNVNGRGTVEVRSHIRSRPKPRVASLQRTLSPRSAATPSDPNPSRRPQAHHA